MSEMLQLENAFLRVLIAPQYGGKVWRAYDKVGKRELFLNNPALQPVNFANRGAWTSGGIEFNWNPGTPDFYHDRTAAVPAAAAAAAAA